MVEKNKNKKVNGKNIKQGLLDYNDIVSQINENTTDILRDLLKEEVKKRYNQILTEDTDDKEDDYEEEEVEDVQDSTADDVENETLSAETEDIEDTDDDSLEDADEAEGMAEEEGDDWKAFDKYKVGEGEYDFSKAEDDDVVKVYKLLKDDDQVIVKNDNGKVNIKDNETGAEYIVDTNPDEDEDSFIDDEDSEYEFDMSDMDADDNDELKDESMKNEQRIYEIALNEYDANLGYTDDYQKHDVMTNPGMSEPGKNVNDWDAGVPKGDAKPWSGYPSKKNKADKPFNAGKGKQVEENFDIDDTISDSDMDIEECGDIEQMEEGAGRFGHVQKHTKSKKHIGTNPFEKSHLKVQHSNSNAEDGYKADNQDVNEAILMKANKIFTENKKLKNYLTKFKNVLQEAAVTNVSLGNIIKLISENATSKDEKQEIISRFGKECKTVEDSNKLYESISNDLKKKEKLNISESKQYSVEDSKKINETKIYMSNDLKDSLDLMHRLCKY